MRAGKLNKPVTIKKPVETEGSFGGVEESYEEVAQVWADIIPLSGKERFVSGSHASEVSHKIDIRYMAGITSKMVVEYEDRTFDIQYPINVGERNVRLHLMSVERDV